MSAVTENSLSLLQAIYDQSPDWVFVKDAEGRILYANDAYAQVARLDRVAMLGADEGVLGLLPCAQDTENPVFRPGELQALAGETVTNSGETFMLGERRVFACETYRVALDLGGSKRAVLTIARDTTEQVLLEDALAESEAKYRLLAENATDMIAQHKADSSLVYVSPVCQQMLGYRPAELIGMRRVADFMHPDDVPAARVVLERLKTDGCAVQFECRLRRKNGQYVWVESSVEPVFNPQTCQLDKLISITRDISARKQVEEKLRLTKQHLSAAIESIDSGLVLYDANDCFVFCNRRYREVFPEVEAILRPGVPYVEVLRALTQAGLHEGSGMNAGEWIEMRLDCHRVPGGFVELPVKGLYVRVTDTRVAGGGTVSLISDVTESRYAQQEIQRQKTLLDSLLDAIPDLIFYKDANGVYITANNAFADYVGIPRHEIEGKTDSELFDKKTAIWFTGQDAIVRAQGKARHNEEWIRYPDGRRVLLDTLKTPFVESESKVHGLVGISRDITHRYEMEQALQHRDNLLAGLAEAVSTLMAGLDDFNPAISKAMRIVGEAAEVHRVYIFQIHGPENGRRMSQLFEWSHRSVEAQINNPELQDFPFDEGFARWEDVLGSGRLIYGDVDTFPAEERPLLKEQDISSLMVVPIFISEMFWGFMGFDVCGQSRKWSDTDASILRTVATSFGNALERKRSRDKLTEAVERANRLAIEAQEANRAKTDFLANISHEIRTPLNGVNGFTALLKSSNLPERQKHFVMQIERSSELLLTLINDLLDLSKITAGQFSLTEEPFEPVECIEVVCDAFAPRLEEKDLMLRKDMGVSTPGPVFRGDSHRLKQILFNLIGNAVKFTERGGISVSFRHAPVESTPGMHRLEFSVADSGIGIPAERVHKLFQPFAQADASIGRRFGGTGLGLSISRELVRLMGGEMSVETEEGRGSLFRFFICCEEIPAEEGPGKKQSANPFLSDEQEVSEMPRVLVADDNFINRDVLTMFLEEMGIEADQAEDGAKAAASAEETQYDLIFMDLRMPNMDGMEATRRIRHHEKQNGLPRSMIVALTADAIQGDIDLCRKSGMDDYLTKPIEPGQIGQIVRRCRNSEE